MRLKFRINYIYSKWKGIHCMELRSSYKVCNFLKIQKYQQIVCQTEYFLANYCPTLNLPLFQINKQLKQKMVKNYKSIQKQLQIKTKVKNMKKLLQQVKLFFRQKQVGIKYGDIDLVDIAKNNSIIEISKLMELILSVLVKCQNKDHYINIILSLSKQTQLLFAALIQKGLSNRICPLQQVYSNQIMQQFQRIQLQNQTLYQQIQKLVTQNQILQAQIKKYQDQLEEYSIIQRKQSLVDQSIDQIQSKNQHTLSLIANLKQKIYVMSGQHQQQLFDLNQQIQNLKEKVKQNNHLEQMLILYRQKYEECLQYLDKVTLWQKQKNKFSDTLFQKNIIIQKLQQQIIVLNEQNVHLQQQQLQLQLSLQQVKAKLKQYQFNSYKQNQEKNINEKPFQQLKFQQNQYRSFSQKVQFAQKIQLLTLQNKRLQRKLKQLQKQNERIKFKIERLKNVQQEKNTLQKLIMDLQTRKNQQNELLVNCLYETNKQYAYLFRTFIKQ